MSRVVDLLANLSSQDAQVRRSAEDVIYKARDANIGTFLMELIYVVRDESIGAGPRQQALILLKNTVAFQARDEDNKRTLEARWASVSADLKQTIRTELLSTLGSSVRPVRHIAALVVANLARIELPAKQWVDLVESLYTACQTEKFQEAAITTLGYVCEESLNCGALEAYLQSHSARILEAVITGMQKQDTEISYQATNALCGSISFIHKNMEVADQRDFIMKSIFQNCMGKESRIINKALECLTRVAYEYYSIIGPYMDVMLNVTLQAIQSGDEQQALQGLMFWSTVCEVEVDLEDAGEGAQNQKYAQATAQRVLPYCLNALIEQDEDREDDEWDICAAGGVCLQAYAQALKGTILQHVVQFITSNINDADWRKKDAAITAFGGILDGPASADIGNILMQAYPALLNFTEQTHHKRVRESSIWCLGRVANFHPEIIVNTFFDQTIEIAARRMQEGGRIGNKACTVIHNLCCELSERAIDAAQASNPFSKYFDALIQVLLVCIDTKNNDEHGLSMAAQETLSSLITCAASDVLPKVHHLIPELLMRVKDNIELYSRQNIDDATRDGAIRMLALLCGTIQNICSKLSRELRPEEAQNIASALFSILSLPGALMHEPFLAIGPLATAMKASFVPYLNETARHLTAALKCIHEDVIIRHSMSTVSDLCFALENSLSTEFCDTMMAAMLEFMQNAEAPMNTKILALTSMGDIALQIGARFEKYFAAVFPVIESAGAYVKTVDSDNLDMLDLREDLVQGVCECFTGFIQGYSHERDILAPYVMHMTEFIGYFGSIEGIGEQPRDLCVQVLGDILNVFKDYYRGDLLRAIHTFINDPRIGEIIRKAKHCSTESYRNSAQWTQEQIVLFLKSYMSNMGGHH